MKFSKRGGLLTVAAVAAIIGITPILAACGTSNPGAGTQSDKHVGTSAHPAPKVKHHAPSASNLEAVTNPGAIPPLSDVNATCPQAPAHDSAHPSLQDDNQGAQDYADMPANPSTATYKCAIARAKAAGYVVASNSVKCDEPTIDLLSNDGKTLWPFRPFCMNVGQSGDPTCKVPLVVTDYAGNFLRQSEPDLKRLQNFLAQAVLDEDPAAYGRC